MQVSKLMLTKVYDSSNYALNCFQDLEEPETINIQAYNMIIKPNDISFYHNYGMQAFNVAHMRVDFL